MSHWAFIFQRHKLGRMGCRGNYCIKVLAKHGIQIPLLNDLGIPVPPMAFFSNMAHLMLSRCCLSSHDHPMNPNEDSQPHAASGEIQYGSLSDHFSSLIKSSMVQSPSCTSQICHWLCFHVLPHLPVVPLLVVVAFTPVWSTLSEATTWRIIPGQTLQCLITMVIVVVP